MFEHYTESHRPRRRSWLTLLFSVSFVGHIAAAGALLVVGMWQIDKLAPPNRSLVLSVAPRPVQFARPAPIERMQVRPKQSPRRAVRSRELVQPTADASDAEPSEVGYGVPLDGDEQGDESAGDGAGDGSLTGGMPFSDGVSFASVTPLARLPEPPRQRVHRIPSEYLDGKRIAGNERIMPPASVRIAMYRNDIRRIEGVTEMCLDNTGRVSTLRTMYSMGYRAYDNKLLREMRHWRYTPYEVDGRPVPVCTRITFIYVVKG